MRRIAIKLLVAIMATCMPLIAVAAPAHADSVADQFLARINGLRAEKGLGSLRIDAQLTSFAQSWTDHMAAANALSHNPQLASSPGSWTKAGENVGVGAAVDALFDAFVASPHHYENLVDPSFTIVGIGVTEADGTLWTTHDFEARPAASAPVATAPAASAPAVSSQAPASASTPTTVPVRVARTVAVKAAPRPAPATPPTTAPPAAVTPTTAPAPPPPPVSVSLPVSQEQPVPAQAPARIRFSLDQSRGVDPIL